MKNILMHHHQRSKRSPLLVAGMTVGMVASIASLVKSSQLAGQVLALEMDLKAMDIKLDASIRMTTEALQKLGNLITENSETRNYFTKFDGSKLWEPEEYKDGT